MSGRNLPQCFTLGLKDFSHLGVVFVSGYSFLDRLGKFSDPLQEHATLQKKVL